MEPSAEIKQRVLKSLPDAYRELTMSRLSEWADRFSGEQKDYACRVVVYLERMNANPSNRAWSVDSDLAEDILNSA